jgi:uncharacterized protein YjbJ (UPF0337 family)
MHTCTAPESLRRPTARPAGLRRESMMRSKGRDKAGGTLDKVRGRIREASGALTGSDRSRAKGQARQGKGEARKRRGHLRDLFRK